MRIFILSLLVFIALRARAQPLTRLVGNKSFELSNHLGNVLEVTTDRKVQQNTEAEIVAFNDYYPYGMLMEGRHVQQVTSDYRYAFQGQEKDDGIKGIGNSYNYTYRMHDSRLGRFFAVDPLTGKYPHYSSYQFSGNRLLDAMELEGLENFSIHGTRQGENYSRIFTDETLLELNKFFQNKLSNTTFTWRGLAYVTNNRDIERKIAAIKLANHVYNVRKWAIKYGHIDESEPITLVGYSHGGNVAIQSSKFIEALTGKKVNIITLGTPAYNDGSVEDPKDNSSIENHIHFYSLGDGIDDIAFANPILVNKGVVGNETYTNDKTKNQEIGKLIIPHQGPYDTHSSMGDPNKNQGLAEFFRNYISIYLTTYVIKDFKIKVEENKPNTDYQLMTDDSGAAGHNNQTGN